MRRHHRPGRADDEQTYVDAADVGEGRHERSHVACAAGLRWRRGGRRARRPGLQAAARVDCSSAPGVGERLASALRAAAAAGSAQPSVNSAAEPGRPVSADSIGSAGAPVTAKNVQAQSSASVPDRSPRWWHRIAVGGWPLAVGWCINPPVHCWLLAARNSRLPSVCQSPAASCHRRITPIAFQ
jgi:hypothetical protein